MKAWQQSGGLHLVERPDPVPGPGEVVIDVKAVSLNYRDVLIAMMAGAPGGTPYIPCSDAAGVIAAVGAGVTRVAPGDRVAATFYLDWADGAISEGIYATSRGQPGTDGVLAEQILVKETAVAALPDGLDFEAASCLPCAGVTAWNGLIEQGRLTQGQTVLVLGTGGVSIMTLQLAKAAGARVIITSSSDEKLERARALGADAGINYRTTPDWAAAARKANDGRGVDHVMEVGGGGTMAQSLEALAPSGHLIVVGIRAGFGDIPLLTVMQKTLRVNGVLVGTRVMLERLIGAITLNRIRPVVDRTYAFADAEQALSEFGTGAHFGKIVIAR